MKSSMKKYLMLLLAILSIVTLGVLTASAEEPTTQCNHGQYNSYDGSVYDATCTSEGYTEIKCGNCNQVIGRQDIKPVKGHKFTWTYVVTGDHYEHRGSCATCGYVQAESDDDNNPIIYYSIAFKNPAAAASYITNITYTKVVKERKGVENAETYNYYTDKSDPTKNQELLYVEAGAEYRDLLPKTPNISCEKDEKYGKYEFIGWFDATSEPILLDAGDSGDAQLVALNSTNKNYLDKPADGIEDTINGNMVLYAGFRGVNITYTVSFYNYDGKALARSTGVYHGGPTVYNLETPTKPYDMVSRYSFNYWGFNGNRVDLNKIYADVAVTANYIDEKRQYNVEYYFDEACTKPVINMDVIVKDSNIKYGEKATNGLLVPEKVISSEKAKDDMYIYVWTGKWVLASRQDYVVDLESFTVPNLTPDALDGSTCVRVIPQYLKRLRVYDLSVQIAYPDDGNYHPEEVNIQILYANGQTADVRTVTMENDTYSYKAEVNYSTSYSIAVSSTGYLGEKTSYFLSNADDPDLSSPAGVIIELEKVGAYSCGCICHTFLKPMWIRVLRLLHTLFGIEYVCCSDMYANIGSSLNYGPGK